MISGRSSDTTYEQTENLKPGKTSSVTAAPPSTWRRSRTSTLRPARARYAAAVRPLWPPPMITTSYRTSGHCILHASEADVDDIHTMFYLAGRVLLGGFFIIS